MTVSVLIITLNRPDCVQRCLDCLRRQEPLPDQIIVVDASPDDLTQKVVAAFPEALYLRNDHGYGRMTTSRNIGLKQAVGDIISFLDDDAFAHDGWLEALLAAYGGDPQIGAVGGRALNNQPNEASEGVGEIGTLKSNGTLTGFFAADPGKIIEVSHVMGCNMSFRREVVVRLNGFREDYPGISGVREDSDMCLRVKRLGYKILFNPAAVVTHIGAPQAKGKRFDLRYEYFSARNHSAMLIRNYGPFAPIAWKYLIYTLANGVKECLRKIAAPLARFGVNLIGTLSGTGSGLLLLLKTGRDPARRDPAGQAISAAMQANTECPVLSQPTEGSARIAASQTTESA